METSMQLFKAFADPTRLRILNLLRSGDLCVCNLIEVLHLPQSTISRHLAHLKRAGLVETWEEGTWNHYRLSKPANKLHQVLLGCLGQCLGDVPQLTRDKRKLTTGCQLP
jgi:ArsR family transcriptional regulator